MHCVQYGLITLLFFFVSLLCTWLRLPTRVVFRENGKLRRSLAGENITNGMISETPATMNRNFSFLIQRTSSNMQKNRKEEVDRDSSDAAAAELNPLSCAEGGLYSAAAAGAPRSPAADYYSPEFLQTQEHVCQVTEDVPDGPFLLVQVHSHPAHKERRDAIRATWGAVTRNFDSRLHIGLVFLLGLSNISRDLNLSVLREGRLYRDIVQGSFADTYRNLTIKSIMGLRWTNAFCCNTRFVLKTDDDVYFNMSLLMAYLQGLPRQRGILVGSIYEDSQVMREGQWRVRLADFPFSVYPPYCAGAAYVMSPDVSRRLHSTFVRKTPKPLLTIEDAYITGFLANSANISCSHSDLFPNWMSTPSIKTLRRFFHGKVIAVHGVPYAAMYQIEKLIKLCTDCGTNMSNLRDWFLWIGRNSTFGT